MSGHSRAESISESPTKQSSSRHNMDRSPTPPRDSAASKQPKSWKSRAKSLWAKTLLDVPTVSVMLKGALAPTIILAAFQSDAFSAAYATTGYLVAIISILSFPILPRGKFLQHVTILVLSLAITLAVVLLAVFCCVKARAKKTANVPTTASGANALTYDSSAAGVAGVWLFFLVYLVNVLRFRFPQFAAPGITPTILVNIIMLYAPQMSTMAQGTAFALRTVEAMFTGIAVAIGVSILVFPVNMRGIVFKEMTGYIMTMRKLMRANMDYIQSLETGDMFSRTPTGATDRPRRKEAQDIKKIISELMALHAKLGVDLPFAKREVAWGKLGPDDLADIFQKLRVLVFVVIGFSSLNDIFERTTESKGWNGVVDNRDLSEIEDATEKAHAQAVHDWHQIAAMLKGPFQHFTGDIDDGLAHILVVLQLLPQKAAVRDLEASGGRPNPGDAGFTEHFGNKISEFRAKKTFILQQFCKLRGINLPQSFFENPDMSDVEVPDWESEFPESDDRERYRRQLYLILWMDYQLESIGNRVHDFCQFVDRKAESGKLSKKRLVVPGFKRLRKHFRHVLSSKTDQYHDEATGMMSEDGNRASNVYLGAAYHKRKDPEHLPPESLIERIGDELRKIPHFLRSKESVFGLRVALATMCAAIIGLVAPSRTFYISHRGFWAQIMVAISMAPSAAQSLFGFSLRLFGTFLAMCTALAVWYIVDGHIPGVIVLYWFVIMWGFFVMVKFPRFIAIGMIFSVTNTLIIGYERQTDKIGIARSQSTGQLYYPTYLLAPYRLATVAAGIALAWIWTIFPFPLSEHSELRRDLGHTFYLLANYNSIMDEVIGARIRGDADINDPLSPYNRLQKARNKVYAKTALTMQALRVHLMFLRYDVPIGGRFPEEIYVKIINRMQNVFNFMTMVILASETFAEMCDKDSFNSASAGRASEANWLSDFRRLVDEANTTNKEFTTLLAMLSASVASGNPLPPYLNPPQPYMLAKRLDAMDRSILSIRHMSEPGFAAFACMQIGTKCINDDVTALLRDVKQLVGEMDFSFHIVSVKDGKYENDDEMAILSPLRIIDSNSTFNQAFQIPIDSAVDLGYLIRLATYPHASTIAFNEVRTAERTPIPKEDLLKVIEALLFSRRFIISYNLVLVLLLLAVSCSRLPGKTWWWRRVESRSRSGALQEAPWNSETSTLTGTSTLRDASSLSDEYERRPLLKSHQIPGGLHASPSVSARLSRSLYRIRGWVMHQPANIPVVNKTMPSNLTSLAVIFLYALNIYFLFYRSLSTSYLALLVFADRAGLVFVANLPLLYLLSAKNCPVRTLTGYSYENINIFHRRLGELLALLALVHGVAMLVVFVPSLAARGLTLTYFLTRPLVWLGISALFCYEILYLTSLSSFRQRCYELFLALHIILQAGALAFLFFHYRTTRPYVLISAAIFIFDRLIYRLSLTRRTYEADLTILPDGATLLLSISFPLPSNGGLLQRQNISTGWLPTDHVFLSVPALGPRNLSQSYPFTIASAAPLPDASHAWLDLHIRARSGFTSDLLRYAQRHTRVTVALGGPYGSSHARAMLRASRVAVCVAGGSGIAVAFPLAWWLAHLPVAEGPRVVLVWIVRDSRHVEWLGTERLEELRARGVEVVVPPATKEGGRPAVRELLDGAVGEAQGVGVVVSGPDEMNRDVRNWCAKQVSEGRDMSVAVEKFGW